MQCYYTYTHESKPNVFFKIVDHLVLSTQACKYKYAALSPFANYVHVSFFGGQLKRNNNINTQKQNFSIQEPRLSQTTAGM